MVKWLNGYIFLVAFGVRHTVVGNEGRSKKLRSQPLTNSIMVSY